MNSAALLLKVLVAASLMLQQPGVGVKVAATMAARPLPVEAVNLHAQLAPKLSATARTKVMGAATQLRTQLRMQLRTQPATDAAQIQSQARAAASQAFPGLTGMDIDTVAFLVMMQVSNDAQNDLKATMDQVQTANKQKQAARDASNKMSDTSQEMQLKLQMQQEQYSKMEEALSNIMKKTSSTSSSVVQNLK